MYSYDVMDAIAEAEMEEYYEWLASMEAAAMAEIEAEAEMEAQHEDLHY